MTMADSDTRAAEKVREREAQRIAKAQAAAGAEAEEKALDETIPGGSYIVNGKTVNADGEEI